MSSHLGHRLACAAADFIGVPFQLQGRDPNVGLDCVGLVACSLQKIGVHPSIPIGYRLRNSTHEPWLKCAKETGLIRASGPPQTGDILFIKVGPGQQHLVIVESANSIIHAHAGVRKVVRQPMHAPPDLSAHWRLS